MKKIQTKVHPDVYELVTNRIIEHLEKGVVPWQRPWTGGEPPTNLINGKPYRGINVWLLNSQNYSQNYFLTFKQVKELGGSIKKGEQALPVIFWKWLEKENNETKEIENVPILRYYNVFNIGQCEGIPREKLPQVINRKNVSINSCEKIIQEMPKRPKIQHDEQRAYYNRQDDYVNMPKVETFKNSEGYYGTLFHELVHSTGHNERLNRKELLESKGFKSEDYAIEELTAEMGSSYLKSYARIPVEQLENNAAYIQSWLERLKKDKKFIIYASSQAQKATDFILNIRHEAKELDLIEEQGKPVKLEDRGKALKKLRDKNKRELIGKER
jgi:antirestriction protein ArdC